MNKKYTLFGSAVKEPPQLTMARTVICVGRDADEAAIKKKYRALTMQWFPDRHIGMPTYDEATQRFAAYSSAYKLLTDTDKRKEASEEFAKCLQQPVVIGGRVFSLGQLYGVRIYVPQGPSAVIHDPSRLLAGTGAITPIGVWAQEPMKVYGIRQSILESKLSDALVTYYGGSPRGHNDQVLFEGFCARSTGGLDDLPWIRSNDIAVNHFMQAEYDESVERLLSINKMISGNVIFMYRLGVSLEARAARLRQGADVKQADLDMMDAVKIYEKCLTIIRKRGEVYADEDRHHVSDKQLFNESQLTVMMQLADAYSHMGILYAKRAHDLWVRVVSIDPDCYEAQQKSKGVARQLAETTGKGFLGGLRRLRGLLPGRQKDT